MLWNIEFWEEQVSNEDFLTRMQLEYVDVGMIHYVDNQKDFDNIFNGKIRKEIKRKRSYHAFRAVETGIIDVILFSIDSGSCP